MFCGEAGCSIRSEYTAVGFKVNLSARIMGVAEKQDKEILCDESTYESARTKSIYLSPLPHKVSIKGISTEIQLYRPLGKKQVAQTEIRIPVSKRSKRSILGPRKFTVFNKRAPDDAVIGREDELNEARKSLKSVTEIIQKPRDMISLFKYLLMGVQTRSGNFWSKFSLELLSSLIPSPSFLKICNGLMLHLGLLLLMCHTYPTPF